MGELLRRRMAGRLGKLVTAALAAVGAGVSVAACGDPAPPAPPPSQGTVLDRPVPDVPLLDAQGRTVSLASFRGRIIVMAPYLTLCQEECPLVAGAFLSLQRDLVAAGLSRKVTILTVSVDPWRDSPARLAAYQARFGIHWPMLTGSLPTLRRFWSSFGVYFQKVPEGSPPGTDWLTGAPLTMDVVHTDGFVLLDARGHERFFDANMPDLHGHLRPDLAHLLDGQGLANLRHPAGPTWTLSDLRAAVGWLAGRQIPASS
ncbi:MAG TPA: SCO family protein [Acidimicrobiales bacterium]|nr:SCO family protein [Acidimicrobiales bacterium]